MMRKLIYSVVVVLCFYASFYIISSIKTTTSISTHIGKPYDQVVRDSSFPIKSKTVTYSDDPPEPGSVWIQSPVVIKFDDPQHGFTLPPTIFGVMGFNNGKVATLTTSPMLKTLPFNETVSLLNDLQKTLKDVGWTPRDEDRNRWLNINNTHETDALQSVLFDHARTVMLVIPHKYMMALIIKCYARCNERNPKTARYLIDVSVGRDFSRP